MFPEPGFVMKVVNLIAMLTAAGAKDTETVNRIGLMTGSITTLAEV